MNSPLELVRYQRVRKPDEYNIHFQESDVMAQRAKDVGFENVTIRDNREGREARKELISLRPSRPSR